MSGSTISTTVTSTVTPGLGGYGSSIVITNTGAISTSGGPALAPGVSPAGANAAIFNDGQITTAADTFSAELVRFTTLNNAGTILGGSGVYAKYGTATNTGTITGTSLYGLESIGLKLTNVGSIGGASAGVTMFSSGYLINSGNIYGGITGATLWNGINVNNAGSIGGAVNGIAFLNTGGTEILTNSGTISGGTNAIYEPINGFALIVDPGAVFNGAVVDHFGTGQLILGGSGAGTLDMGNSFSGFSNISFLSVLAPWTLEGSTAALANGQLISGFAPGNDLILDGFAATSASFISSAGLVLSNATGSEILNLGTSGDAATSFDLTSDGTNSTITALGPTPTLIRTITGAAGTVTPGSGRYASNITITATGAANGIYNGAYVSGVSVLNDGTTNFVSLWGSTYSAANTLINNGIILSGANPLSDTDAVDFRNGTLLNTGTIMSTATYAAGVVLQDATLTNLGYISGYTAGVFVSNGGEVINAGTITGAPQVQYQAGRRIALENQGTGAFNLVVEPGAAFIGDVFGGGLTNGLTLAGTSAGTLDLGNTFSGFNTIHFDAGSVWTLEGTESELARQQTITGFTVGDTIVLDSFAATGKIYAGGDKLILLGATANATLDVISTFTTSEFLVSVNAAGGTDISALCYLRGTSLLGPAGECRVEDICIGDALITCFGGYQKVKWVGRQSFSPRFAGPQNIPVRIAAGALGPDLPGRDLYVSPGHSLLLGPTLVLARSLVNGITITQPAPAEDIEYYLIEFDGHDCVLAEGIWAESYADGPGLRARFHNASEYYALYPDEVAPEALQLCAPRPEQGAALAVALAPIVARASSFAQQGTLRGMVDLIQRGGLVEGWAQDLANPYLPVWLEIVRDGRVLERVLACDYRPDLEQAGIGTGRAMFSVTVEGGLDATARKGLAIRRAGDGQELPRSQHCLNRLAAA